MNITLIINPLLSLPQIDHVNVEESLSASSLHHMIRGGSNSPSASGTKGMKYAKEFQDFTSIDISRYGFFV